MNVAVILVATLSATLLAALAAFAGAMQRLKTAARERDESRAAERRVAAECARLGNAFDSIADGLAVFDRSGRLVLANAPFLELLELPQRPDSLSEVLLRQARRGDFGPGEPEAQAHERAAAFLDLDETAFERFTVGVRTIQVRRQLTLDGVVALYSDITDRRLVEERLTQACAEAELGNRAKSEFLANMSHELRTPLNAIIGFSEIIGSRPLGALSNEKLLEYINDIHSSGMHLLAIVNDVLDMSKIEAGKLELCHVPVDVGPMVADSTRMVAERARRRGVRIVADNVDECTVVADERAIKQITLNLLSNAVKFSKEREEIRIGAWVENDGSFNLEVEDHGIGMTEEGIARALQPFGQVNTPATRTQSGTGLGLPITKGLVEAHGGRLCIDSRAGVGTTVRVVLPPPAPMPDTVVPRPAGGSARAERAVA